MENADVARTFDEVADLLEIKGENAFRVRAYRNAARTLESLPTPVARLLERGEGALSELPGIGRDLAGKIHTLVDTGHLPVLEELLAEVPEGLVTLLRVEGLGPKRARLIYDHLGIDTLDGLEAAAREGRLHALRGIGPALEHKVLDGIARVRARSGRFRLDQADAWAASIRSHLEGAEGLLRLEIAGSYRRRKETVGDLDVLAAATATNGVAERFLAHPDIARVLARGATRCAIALTSGVNVDLRIVRAASFGAALHYFTGSRAHNIAIRTLGLRRGLRINEYGVFRRMRRIAGRSEEEIVDVARRGWCTPRDIVNSYPLAELRRVLHPPRAA